MKISKKAVYKNIAIDPKVHGHLSRYCDRCGIEIKQFIEGLIMFGIEHRMRIDSELNTGKLETLAPTMKAGAMGILED